MGTSGTGSHARQASCLSGKAPAEGYCKKPQVTPLQTSNPYSNIRFSGMDTIAFTCDLAVVIKE